MTRPRTASVPPRVLPLSATSGRVFKAQAPKVRGRTDKRGVFRWELRVSAGTWPDGRRRIEVEQFTGTKTQADRAAAAFALKVTEKVAEEEADAAADAAADLTVAVGTPSTSMPRNIKFGDLINRYYDYRYLDWVPKTRLENRRLLPKLLTCWALDKDGQPAVDSRGQLVGRVDRPVMEMRVRDLRPHHINDLYEDLRNHGGDKVPAGQLADIDKQHTIVAGALAWARQKGVRDDNPADDSNHKGSRPPMRRNDPSRRISMEDFILVWQAAMEADPILAGVLGTEIFVSGLRRSEMAGLRWPDIDKERLTVTVRNPISYGLDEQKVARLVANPRTKTNQECRIVAIGHDALDYLLDFRRLCVLRATASLVQLAPDAYIFSSKPDGSRPYHPESLSRKVRHFRQKLGIEEFDLQRLRGLVSSELIRHRVDEMTYMSQMGHEFTTALKAYAVADEAGKRSAAEVICSVVASHCPSAADNAAADVLLAEAADFLATLPPVLAERCRSAVRQVVAAGAAEARRGQVTDLASRRAVAVPQRSKALPERAAEVAQALRSAGHFTVDATEAAEMDLWRKAARYAGRMTLGQPVRTTARDGVLYVQLLARIASPEPGPIIEATGT